MALKTNIIVQKAAQLRVHTQLNSYVLAVATDPFNGVQV